MNAPANYVRRQTLKGAERYITPELQDFEGKVLSARDRALAREKDLYDELLARLVAVLAPLRALAEALAETDVLAHLGATRDGSSAGAGRNSLRSRASTSAPDVTRWSSRCWSGRSSPTTWTSTGSGACW